MDVGAIVLAYIIVFIVIIILAIAVNHADDTVWVKSGAAVDNYDYFKYFKEDRNRIDQVEKALRSKKKYKLRVRYVSPAGRKAQSKNIILTPSEMQYVKAHPELVMSASEYNQIVREQKMVIKAQEKAIKEKQKENEKAERERLKAEKDAEKERIRQEKQAEKEQVKALLE